MDAEPQVVQANLDCLKKDCVLLVDTFFVILIWKGKNIKEWEEAGYHLQEDYKHLREAIELPYEDWQHLLMNKLYHPEILEATEGSPFERILKSKLNPEKAIGQSSCGLEDESNFFTEDAPMSIFMEKLL